MKILEQAREAFLEMMKSENFDGQAYCRVSLEPHFGGREVGFSDARVQSRWFDFREGYIAGMKAAHP